MILGHILTAIQILAQIVEVVAPRITKSGPDRELVEHITKAIASLSQLFEKLMPILRQTEESSLEELDRMAAEHKRIMETMPQWLRQPIPKSQPE